MHDTEYTIKKIATNTNICLYSRPSFRARNKQFIVSRQLFETVLNYSKEKTQHFLEEVVKTLQMKRITLFVISLHFP